MSKHGGGGRYDAILEFKGKQIKFLWERKKIEKRKKEKYEKKKKNISMCKNKNEMNSPVL
jgi:hypothetical protein